MEKKEIRIKNVENERIIKIKKKIKIKIKIDIEIKIKIEKY